MTFFPGNAGLIRANAHELRTEATRFDATSEQVAGIVLNEWDTDAGVAARRARRTMAGDLAAAHSAYDRCAGALETFADGLERLEEGYRQAAQALELATARSAAGGGFFDPDLLVENLRFSTTRSDLIDEYPALARTAEAEIVAAANEAAAHGGGGPFQTQVFPSDWGDEGVLDRKVPLDGEVDLSDAGLDPLLIKQGGAGDCWYIAALISIADSPGGADFIRDHMEWDEEKQGYWVTLYFPDGSPGKYFVDSVYADGAGQGRVNWASVYEAALVQHEGGEDDINGGYSDNAFEIITGGDASRGGTDVDKMRDALEDGKPVAVSTDSERKVLWVEWGGAPTVDAQVENPPGVWTSTEIDIVDGHAYSVVDVDDDGNVFVVNPWGPGNSSDGGGVIKLSEEEFERAFSKQSIGSPL